MGQAGRQRNIEDRQAERDNQRTGRQEKKIRWQAEVQEARERKLEDRQAGREK